MTVSSYEFIMDIISSNDISLSKSEESILNTLKLHSYDITSFDIADFAKTFFVKVHKTCQKQKQGKYNSWIIKGHGLGKFPRKGVGYNLCSHPR